MILFVPLATGEVLTIPVGYISINNGAEYSKNKEVCVQISASLDGPPIHKMKIANSIAELEAVEWQDVVPVVSWPLSENDGNKTVFAKFKDLAGTESDIAVASIILDQTAPQVWAGSDKASNSSFIQAGFANDINGIASYQWQKVSGPGDLTLTSANTSATVITATIDGKYRMRLSVTDVAGNSSYSVMNFIWDTTKPVYEYMTAPDRYSHVAGALVFKGTTTDQALVATSGIKEVKLYKGTKRLDISKRRAFTLRTDTLNIKNGRHLFRVVATDNAGNTNEWSRYYTVDNTKPAIPSMYITPTNPTKLTEATVFYRVSDNLSSKIQVQIYITTESGSIWKTFDLGARNKDISLSKVITMRGIPGRYIYKIAVTDKAGNRQIRQLTFNISDTWNAANLRTHVNQLAAGIGPREAGTGNEHRAAEYIKGELTKYGYAVTQQSFRLPNGRISYNVTGSRPGYAADKKMILGSHYDSKAGSPGANDNASGTSVLLELAKYFRYKNTNAGLTFAFFGSEEKVGSHSADHHFGSRYYVRSMSALDKSQTVGMINIDMIGVGSNFHIRSMQKGPTTLVNEMLTYARNNRYGLYFLKDTGRTGMSDHEPFELASIPVAWLQWRSDPNYHTKNDTYSRVQWSRVDTAANLVKNFLAGK